MPAAAVLGFAVQPMVAPVPGWVVMARVMELAAVGTVLPPGSWTVTTGCVAHACPSTPPPGSVVKASCEAAPMVIGMLLLVALVRPVAEAVRV